MRFRKLGEALFNSDSGKEWLKLTFGSLIEKYAACNRHEYMLFNKISQWKDDAVDTMNRRRNSSLLRWARFMLHIKTAWNLLCSIKDSLKALKEAAIQSSMPELTIPEQGILLATSPAAREEYKELFSLHVEEAFDGVIGSIARAIFEPVMPMFITMSREILWQTIDIVLAALSLVGKSISLVRTVGNATSKFGAAIAKTGEVLSASTIGQVGITAATVGNVMGKTVQYTGKAISLATRPFGFVIKAGDMANRAH